MATCTVIVGTYEKLILGYELTKESDNKWEIKLVFTNNSHLAPVRCLAISATRGILASAGSDEAIRLLDLKRRVEVGSLPYHSGSVNMLQFYKHSHLFSASDDGKLAVWRRRDWRLLKAFRRHKGQPVKGVAVHPTGCLALSVGNDRTLRTWDLVAGKNAFAINLKEPAQSIIWSPDGTYFAVIFDYWIDVYSAETGRVCASLPESHKKAADNKIISPSKKITTAIFVSNEVIMYAMESGLVHSVNIPSFGKKSAATEVQAHNLRVKGISLASFPSKDTALVLTASSDGEIKLWRHRLPPVTSGNESFECLATQKTGFRILSMATWRPDSPPVTNASANGSKEKKAPADKSIAKKFKKNKRAEYKTE